MSKDATKYDGVCHFPEVNRYAAADTEHAHQTALFMFIARANFECDKIGGSYVTDSAEPPAWAFCDCCRGPGFDPDEQYLWEWNHLRALKLLFAIPNGGERAQAVAARLKAEGVKSGVSDLFLPVPVFEYTHIRGYELKGSGLFLEMKRPEIRGPGAKPGTTKIVQPAGKTSDEQEAWFKDMRTNGYKTATAWTFGEALYKLHCYLNGYDV